ncbi:MAG TPA: prepilin-type N-terminal cleavage/methylation domain-containing protein [Vicinamibacteria bacterium]|nr:prepilin-type N-terminal cleavage/methylation domain-containing protein [Vicinamibacteria bacterium]
MRAARSEQSGFTLIEIVIVLAISVVVGMVLFRITRASWLLYNVQTHQMERGYSGLRSIDDMAIEIARAGYGLGDDAGPVFPGTLAGVRSPDAITVRSNPGGIAGVLRENLVERDRLVKVDGAEGFAVGDEVLLVDQEGTLERAQVSKMTPDALAFRSSNGPGGALQGRFLAALDARVLKVREVGFYLKTDGAGVPVVARKAIGQSEQILARYVGALQFDYFDENGAPMDPARIGPGFVPGSVQIALRLVPVPGLPPVTVPPLRLLVPLEQQSATIAFDTYAFHRVGVTAVVGQDPATADLKAGLAGWRKSEPLF